MAFVAVAQAFVKAAQEAVKERTEYYRIAAESYASVDGNGKAFTNAFKFIEATLHYNKKAGMFNEAVAIIKNHRTKSMLLNIYRILHGSDTFAVASSSTSVATHHGGKFSDLECLGERQTYLRP